METDIIKTALVNQTLNALPFWTFAVELETDVLIPKPFSRVDYSVETMVREEIPPVDNSELLSRILHIIWMEPSVFSTNWHPE